MKIEFIPTQDNLLKPEPTVRLLPDWYKQKSPFVDGGKKLIAYPDRTMNVTIKWCNPFGDALGAGYFVLLENDVQVTIVDGEHEFVWLRGGDGLISAHSKKQISDELVPQGYSPEPWKFKNFWSIRTPPGYSVLFTHPLNRTELPFITLSGVVDTDDYNQPVNFPFFIRSDYEGILEAGTPIAQVIPFRRDTWKAEIKEYDHKLINKISSSFSRKIARVYKTYYWKRKEYK